MKTPPTPTAAKREQLRARYLSDPIPVRLGNLTSNLSRIAAYATRAPMHKAVLELIDESKHFIEWTGLEVASDFQPELVRLQVELARWQLDWTETCRDEVSLQRLAERAQQRSDEVLQWSGLLR